MNYKVLNHKIILTSRHWQMPRLAIAFLFEAHVTPLQGSKENMQMQKRYELKKCKNLH